MQQNGCPHHPGSTGARELWHLDQHKWTHNSHNACTVRKRQLDGWCKSSSRMHFVPAKQEHAAGAKELKRKVNQDAAKLTKLQAKVNILRASARRARTRGRTELGEHERMK